MATKRKSIRERAAECVREIRKLRTFAREEMLRRGDAYTDEHADRDAALCVSIAMQNLIDADRRARKGRAQ